ncbi:hypothetical protein D9M71_768880 [compost metagenome]
MHSDTGVIDQHTNALIITQTLLDAGQICRSREIRRQYLDINAVPGLQIASQGFKPLLVTRDQQQIVTTTSEALRVDRTDSGRRTRDERGRGYRGS